MMEVPYLLSPEDVLNRFGASELSGLSQDQVKNARQKYGPNGQFEILQLLPQSSK